MFRLAESRNRGPVVCDIGVPSSCSDVITFLFYQATTAVRSFFVGDIYKYDVRLDELNRTYSLIGRYSRSRDDSVRLLTEANLVTRWNALTN